MENIVPIYFGVITGFLFIGIALGVKIGTFIERTAWNKLIEEGKIPRPTKKI